jgi:4-carboxymuconolactone decarboxylase
MTSDDRLARGERLLADIHGEVGAKVLDDVRAISPDMADFIAAFAFGDIYARPGLDLRSRQIATIAALVATGHPGRELEAHINGGLNVGLSRAEIIEIILQMAVYAGFPAALDGLNAARAAFAARDARGDPTEGRSGAQAKIARGEKDTEP